MIRTLHPRANRGFALLAVIIALLIVGVLTQQYMAPDSPGGTTWSIQQRDRARSAVATANIRQAETQWIMRTEGRRPPVQQLRRELNDLAQYGSGGRFFLDHNDNLRVTNQLDTPRFADRFDLPRYR